MTPEQIRNHLILDGWIPVRHQRNKGDVWVGIYKEGSGLVYYDYDVRANGEVRHLPKWPFEPTQKEAAKFVSKFKCRWCDVESCMQYLYKAIPL